MTTTAPASPTWLVRLLARCTPRERLALDRYRDSLYVAFDDVRNGRRSYEQLLNHWSRVLRTLEDAACGTPAFDRYTDRQHDRLAAARTNRQIEEA